ncbi:MAG: hypothetical protein WDM81_05685 [Rhizomicrobium sp.]
MIDCIALAISTLASAFSPSASSVAMGALTFTPSVPSGTRSLPILPSSTASNSIVALVGLDLGQDVAGLDGVAFLDEPFGKLALLHGGRQGGHENLSGH